MKPFIRLPWHVLFSALLVPLHILGHNIGLIFLRDGLEGLLLFVFISAGLFLIAAIATRRAQVSGLITTSVVLAGWALITEMPILASIIGIIGTMLLIFAIGKQQISKFTVILNLAFLALLVQPSWLVMRGAVAGASEQHGYFFPGAFSQLAAMADANRTPRPSIIHIVLDGYSSNSVIRFLTGFDNSNFSEQLEKSGFHVFEKARSPYNQTVPTMAAVFNGDYLPEAIFSAPEVDPVTSRLLLGASITRGPLRNFLADSGYAITFTDPGYRFFSFDIRDRLISRDRGAFFARITRDNPIISTLVALQTGVQFSREASHSDQLLQEVLDNQTTYDGRLPIYVYQHLLAPHPPFTIDRFGKPTDKWARFSSIADGSHATRGEPDLRRQYAEGYVEKLQFINRKTLQHVERILSEVPAPRIIIVHGDHGSGILYDPEAPSASCLAERFNPFLAIYADNPLLNSRLAELRGQSFNLVNIYRLILTEEFGFDFPPLEPSSFFIPWENFGPAIDVNPENLANNCFVPWGQ